MKKVQLKETAINKLTYISSWRSRGSNELGCEQDVTRKVVC